MKKASVVAALASALLALALLGCTSDGLASQPADKETLQGVWELDSSTLVGFAASLYLADDDTVELIVGDSMYEGTWSVSDGKATLAIGKEQEVSATYTGEKLVLGSEDNTRLVFTKGDLESLQGGEEGEGPSSSDEAEDGAEGTEGEGEEGEEAEPEEPDDTGDEVIETDGVEIVEEAIGDIEPVVIVDDETCTITVTGKGTDFTADPCYRIAFTNKTDKPLYITAEEPFTVEEKQIVPGLGDVAEPGRTVDATMYFPKEELGGGLDLLVNVTGVINVEIDESYERVADYPFHMD